MPLIQKETSYMKPIVKLAAIAAMWCAAKPANADIIVQPYTVNVAPGSHVSLDIRASGVSDLYAYQFDIGFDPTVLSAESVSEGAFLPSRGSTFFFAGMIDNVGGTITSIADSLSGPVSGVSGSGTLVTLKFSAPIQGSTTVDIFNLTALNSFGAGIAETTISATVNVGPISVPEPSQGLVTCGLLLTMGAFLRRRRA